MFCRKWLYVLNIFFYYHFQILSHYYHHKESFISVIRYIYIYIFVFTDNII